MVQLRRDGSRLENRLPMRYSAPYRLAAIFGLGLTEWTDKTGSQGTELSRDMGDTRGHGGEAVPWMEMSPVRERERVVDLYLRAASCAPPVSDRCHPCLWLDSRGPSPITRPGYRGTRVRGGARPPVAMLALETGMTPSPERPRCVEADPGGEGRVAATARARPTPRGTRGPPRCRPRPPRRWRGEPRGGSRAGPRGSARR